MAASGYRNNGRGAFRTAGARQAAAKRQYQLKTPPHMLRGGERSKGVGIAAIVLGSLALIIALIPAAGMAGGGLYYAQTAAQLKPRLEALNEYKPFQTSRIFDRNGKLLYEFVSNGRRDPVKLVQIADVLKDATIAIEDKNFWTNPGVDLEGIAKAAARSLSAGAETGGASTITQQVIKNIILNDEEKAYENRYRRKLQEAVLAQQLTDEYSKEQILELYLNEINYGNLAYGIQAAAQRYFGKNASDLDLNEASLLAGIPQLPTLYNPMQFLDNGQILPGVQLRNGWRAPGYKLPFNTPPPRQRQVDVLRQMVDNNLVTDAEARAAIGHDLVFVDQQISLEAPHFVFYVKQLLENDPVIGPILAGEGGLTITTTLDLEMQQIAQEQAKKRIDELIADNRNIHNAAVVVQQPGTGQILAMVGSIDYNAVKPTTTPGEEKNVLDGKVNVATSERQPGSALKPFTYLSALNQGVLTPGSILWDVETRFPIVKGADEKNINKCAPDPGAFFFCPKNYDGKWHGPLRMREGLANSLNIPAVLALNRAGIGSTRSLLHSMGISGLQREDSYYGLAMTLGGGEVTLLDLTTAYNTLANNGVYVQAQPILKITDRDGQVVREFTPSPAAQAVDPALVAIVRDFMGDNEARTPLFGPNNPLKLSRPFHAKTGTTDDFRDAWALGFTPYVSAGVWTGNNNNEKTARVESTQGGGIILNRLMEAYFANPRIDRLLRGENLSKPLEFPSPATFGAVESKVCQIGGRFGKRAKEWFTTKMLEAQAKGAGGCDLFRTVEVVRRADGGVCLPREGVNYGDQRATIKVYNLPKAEEGEKILDAKFTAGDEELLSVAPTERCSEAVVVKPTPMPAPVEQPAEPGAPQEPGAPGNPAPGPGPAPAPAPAPAAPKRLPSLVGLGENQAKELLAGLGITSVVVDYQGADRLGDLYNQFPPYVVVSSSPGAGTPIEPGITVVLGIREP